MLILECHGQNGGLFRWLFIFIPMLDCELLEDQSQNIFILLLFVGFAHMFSLFSPQYLSSTVSIGSISQL